MKYKQIFLILLVQYVLAERKFSSRYELYQHNKKKKSKEKMTNQELNEDFPFVSSPKRPFGIEPDDYCFACQAMISIAVFYLKYKNKEHDLYALVDQNVLCDP